MRDVAIEPAALLLHTAAPLRAAFTLTESGEQPLAVRAAACTSPHLRLHPEAPRRRADGWQRRIEVEVLPTLPPGRHEDVMVLYTGDPRCPELKAPLTVVKQSAARVQPSPEAVRLTASSGGAYPPRRPPARRRRRHPGRGRADGAEPPVPASDRRPRSRPAQHAARPHRRGAYRRGRSPAAMRLLRTLAGRRQRSPSPFTSTADHPFIRFAASGVVYRRGDGRL
ncbi:MAG: hypothetical protein U0736_18315 [Gemmataceae bacterium]